MLELIVVGGVYVATNAVIGGLMYLLKKLEKKKLEELLKSYKQITDKSDKILDIVSRSGTERSNVSIPMRQTIMGVDGEMQELSDPYQESEPSNTHRSIHLNDQYKIQVRNKK